MRTYWETGRLIKEHVLLFKERADYGARTTAVTICTTKPDKYDRYLADVFLTLKDGTAVYLNNALLENGHAVRKESWEFGDWGV